MNIKDYLNTKICCNKPLQMSRGSQYLECNIIHCEHYFRISSSKIFYNHNYAAVYLTDDLISICPYQMDQILITNTLENNLNILKRIISVIDSKEEIQILINKLKIFK